MKNVIVVLHYNKIKLTKTCIDSILEAGYPPHLIHCFDNGSKPEIYQEITTLYPGCRHHRCETNKGYSGGFNGSLDWVFSSGADGALFCTNDTNVQPGALEACVKTANDTNAHMVAPRIHYLSDNISIDSIGGWFNSENYTLNHYNEEELPQLLDPKRDYIPGTALWIDKDLFYHLNGTDESYHMYWEDVDLCFRAHRKGFRLARCYDSRIGHGVGQTCRKKPLYTTFYFHRNRARFSMQYLEGEQRERAMRSLEKEFLQMGELWKEKQDQKRLNYLEQLLKELKK